MILNSMLRLSGRHIDCKIQFVTALFILQKIRADSKHDRNEQYAQYDARGNKPPKETEPFEWEIRVSILSCPNQLPNLHNQV